MMQKYSSIRRVRKEYEAIVFGHPEFDSTVINKPIGPRPGGTYTSYMSSFVMRGLEVLTGISVYMHWLN